MATVEGGGRRISDLSLKGWETISKTLDLFKAQRVSLSKKMGVARAPLVGCMREPNEVPPGALAIQSVVCCPVASAPPGVLLEMWTLRAHLRPTGSESAL